MLKFFSMYYVIAQLLQVLVEEDLGGYHRDPSNTVIAGHGFRGPMCRHGAADRVGKKTVHNGPQWSESFIYRSKKKRTAQIWKVS